MMLHLW